MPRRLERTAVIALPNLTETAVLIPPANHKYEVLDVVFEMDGTAGTRLLATLYTASGQIKPFDITTGAANALVARFDFPGLVVYHGDGLTAFAYRLGGPTVHCICDYVDVDFS
jgi:hypothetical protein